MIFGQCSANAGEDIVVCQGNTTTLSATSNGEGSFTYSWSPANGLSCTDCAQPTFSGTVTTQYTVVITDQNNCVATDQVQVIVEALPPLDFTVIQTNACSNIPVSFQVDNPQNGAVYSWNFGNPTSTNNTATGTYVSHVFNTSGSASSSFTVTLTAQTENGCTSVATQVVNVSHRPGALLEDPMSSFRNCDGTNFNLTLYNSTPGVAANYQIIWGDGTPDFSSSTFGTSVSHQYTTADIFDLYFIVTGANGCVDTMFQYISNITNPAIGAANPGATTGCGPIEMCFPLSSYQNNHPSTMYEVDYGDGTPNEIFPHPPPPVICHDYSTTSCGQPGNAFTFQIRAENACDNSIASITPIRVFTSPQTSFSLSSPRGCVNTPIVFQNTSVMGYNTACNPSSVFTWDWGDGTTTTSTTNNNQTHVYTTPGTYTVTLTAVNQCGTSSQSGEICIEAVPAPSFTVDPNPGCIPMLSDISNTTNTDNMCQYTFGWSVHNYSTSCPPSNGNITYQNGTSATSWEPDLLFPGAGTYNLRLTFSNSCGTYYANQTVTAQDLPKVTINGVGTICLGESISPTVTVNNCYAPIDSYQWSFNNGTPTSSTSQNPGAINYTTAGVFPIEVNVTNSCGTTTQTANVTVNAPPIADAGLDQAYCTGGNVQIGTPAQPGVIYSWTPATNLSSSSAAMPTVNAINNGSSPIVRTYTLRARTTATCFTEDQVVVTINPRPTVSFNNPRYCVGDEGQFVVTENMPSTYAWTPATGLSCTDCPNPVVSGAATTTYTVIATNEFGCARQVTATATVNPLPNVNAGADIQLCDQPIPYTNVGTPAGGTWSGDGNITPNGIFTPDGIGNFTLTYTYTNPTTGCVNSDEKVITVIEPTQPTIQPFSELCLNGGITNLNALLTPDLTGGTWQGNGVTGTNFNPTTAGVGEHVITYVYGSGSCAMNATATIKVNPLPNFNLSNATICVGSSTQLNIHSPDILVDIQWTPATGLSCTDCLDPLASPIVTTTYSVLTTNELGCSASKNVVVTVNSLPTVTTGPNQTICDQPIPVNLTATPVGGIWSGSTNVNGNGIFTPNGVEDVTLTYTYTQSTTGCVNTATMQMTVVEPALADAGPDVEICTDNTNITLQATPLGGQWSGNGVSNGQFSLQQPGTYTLMYSYGAGNCLTTDEVIYVVHPRPVLTISEDLGRCVTADVLTLEAQPIGGAWSGSGVQDPTGTVLPADAGVGIHVLSYLYADPVTGCEQNATLAFEVYPLPTIEFVYDPIVCVNNEVSFENQSTLIDESQWHFGNELSSTDLNGITTYTQSGNYNIQLIVTSPFGCVDSLTQSITVYDPPVAQFQVAPDSLCGPLLASFTNQSTGQEISFQWDFGNGLSSTDEVPTNVTYQASAIRDTSYFITLTVSNQCGVAIAQDTVIIMPMPTAIFGTDVSTFCSPWTPNFINSSIGLPDSYYWDFGNGTTSTLTDSLFQLPVYTADEVPTQYTISLIAENECGTSTAQHTITVTPNDMTAFFNTSVFEGCGELTVQFTQYTLTATNYSWSFGDGNVSQVYSPSHTFTQPGEYTVTLNTDDGCNYASTSVVITVHDSPVVAFSSTPDSACVWTPYQFINESDPLAGYSWNFGDGTTSTLTNPTHAYTESGQYTVTLTGESFNGSCVATVSGVVHVRTRPSASFTMDPATGCEPVDVTYTNTTVGGLFYQWNFGDGNSSVASNPTHTFTESGTYTTQLIVQGANGCVDTASAYVNVSAIPVADFTVAPILICGPDVIVQFTNNSQGAQGYVWDFGNGSTSILNNPSQDYLEVGTFEVSLTATNAMGCSHTVTKPVTIHPTPTAIFTLPTTEICGGTPILFNHSSLLADSVIWNFGNGQISYSDTSTFVYENPGYYNVSLTVYTQQGCVDVLTAAVPIYVRPIPIAAFDYERVMTPDAIEARIAFNNQSSFHTNSYWTFGDGNESTEEHPIHDYYQFSEFYTRLIVSDEFGCSDTTAMWVINRAHHHLYVPNAVYPGHDVFDVAHFLPKGIGLKEYLLQIYDDWGNLLWETDAIDEYGRPLHGWDATYLGAPVQQDAYVWKIHAIFLDDSVWEGVKQPNGRYKQAGTITVIR